MITAIVVVIITIINNNNNIQHLVHLVSVVKIKLCAQSHSMTVVYVDICEVDLNFLIDNLLLNCFM